MFKKFYKKLNDTCELVKNKFDSQLREHSFTRECINREIRSIVSKVDDTTKIIESQQRTIEQLTSALQNKCKHGALIVYGEGDIAPLVIKDGNVVSNERMSAVDFSWSFDNTVVISVEIQ